MSSTPHLANLPSETLANIARYLDLKGCKSLRLSCKYVEASIFRNFAVGFFRDVQVMRSEPSLQDLIDLSKSRLAPYVKRLVISTEVINAYTEALASHVIETTGGLNELYHQFQSQSIAQETLIATRRDTELLAEALTNLDLEVIGMRDCHIPKQRTFSSWNRPRKLRSLGSTRLYEAAGISTRELELWSADNIRGCHDHTCLRTMLLSIGKAGARVRRLEVYFDFEKALHEAMFFILGSMPPSVLSMIAELEDLHLEMNGTRDHNHATYNLRTLLSNAHRLQSLSLHFRNTLDEDKQRFIAWLAAHLLPAGAGHSPGNGPPPIPLAHLRKVDISGIEMPMETLLELVRKFSSSLRSMALATITFTHQVFSSWYMAEEEDAPMPCRDLIEALIPLTREWEGIRLSNIVDTINAMNTDAYSSRTNVFNITGKIESGRFRAFSYTGPEVPRALEGLLRCMGARAPPWSPKLEGKWRVANLHDPLVPVYQIGQRPALDSHYPSDEEDEPC